MKPERSSPRSEKPVTCSYPPTYKCSSRRSMLFKIIFSIIIPYKLWTSSGLTSPFFPIKNLFLFFYILVRATHLVHLIFCPYDHPNCLLKSIFYRV